MTLSLLAHAQKYAADGFDVFPVNQHDKTPLVSQYQATANVDTIESWWSKWPDAAIGHRLSEDHIILDIDPRHGGAKVWKALRDEYGKPPATRYHASGRGDGGGHLWFQRPDDKLSVIRLDAWAKERELGEQISETRWVGGIDILHHSHRYTILPPSPHAETGKPYRWVNASDHPVAVPPVWLVELITDSTPVAASKPPSDPQANSIADWYSSQYHFSDLLPKHGWTLRAGDGDADGSRWRHPTATSAFSATVRYGCLFTYSPNTPFTPTAPGDTHGYTLFRTFATLEHNGNLTSAARAARELKDGPRQYINLNDMIAAPTVDGAPVADSPLHLPEVVWDSRTTLTHIRQAARSRLVAPDAVLGAVLTRVAACSPHTLELPATIGSPVGLTFYTAMVGPPESGKSAAAAVAAELLPAPEGVQDRLPIGSGEGMVEILFDMVDEEDENGKKIKVKRQQRYAAIFHIDEGQALADLGTRSGSTLMPTLRTAWTHGTLGNANASIERRRILDGRLYVYGVTLGIQPELAGPLLADTAGGTPQRFLWLMATDPAINEDGMTVWPGPLDWAPPDAGRLADQTIQRGGLLRHPLRLEPRIVADLIADRVAALQGKDGRQNTEAHRMLTRLKTAALLAVLDDRLDVNGEDWHLADRITETSSIVRRAVQHTVDAMNEHAMKRSGQMQAYRETIVDDDREQRAMTAASKACARVVHRHTERHTHPEAGCERSCFVLAISGKDRKLVGTDAPIEKAVELRWLKFENGRWVAGPSNPT